jgi:hypothetical protein
VPVAVVLALPCSFVRAGADHRSRLGLDQRLQGRLDALADQIDVASGAERVEQFVGVKLLVGHWCDLLVVSFSRTRRDSLRWSTTWWILCVIYTNSWDVPQVDVPLCHSQTPTTCCSALVHRREPVTDALGRCFREAYVEFTDHAPCDL